MATQPNVSKHRKDGVQLGCTYPEELEVVDALGNTDPNANCGAEPNFNLNFNLTSPSNPRSTTGIQSATRKEDGNRGGGKPGVNREATPDTKRPLMSPGEKPRRTAQEPVGSPRTPTTRSSRAEQRLKPPTVQHPPVLSHKPETRDVSSSPKPNAEKLMSRSGATERVQKETPGVKPAKPPAGLTNELRTKSTNNTTFSPERETDQPAGVHNQKGGPPPVHLHLTNPTPESPDRRPEHDTRAQGSEISSGPTSSPTQKMESLLVSPTTTQMVSRSPRPPMKGKTTDTRNSKTSGSTRSRHGKDSRAGSGPKTGTKSSSSSKVTRESKDSTSSKSQTRSRDTLNSKSSSASKSSLDSKDSLESKTGPSPKSRTGSRFSLDSKTTRETKAKKIHQDPETVMDPETSTWSSNEPAPKFTENTHSPNPKTGLRVPGSSSASDAGPGSKLGVTRSTSRPSLQDPGLNTDVPGSVSPPPLTRGRPETRGSGTKPSSLPKPAPDSSKSGPVRSSSKSALVDLAPPLMLVSANQSPGSSSGQRLGRSSAGPDKEDQRSPSSSPAPLESFRTRTMMTSTTTSGSTRGPTSSSVMKRNPSGSVQRTGLTRGLTFDSITKATTKPGSDSERERLKPTESRVGAAGDLEGSTGISADGVGRSPGDPGRKSGLLGKLDQLGDANVILSSMSTKEEKRKKMDGSQSLTAASRLVKESWTMTETFQRLRPPPAEQRDVGVQVEVEVVQRSASTSPSLQWEAPICSLIGSPSCQSSLSWVPPLKIDIELNSQSQVSSTNPGLKTSSPASCWSGFSLKQSPAHKSEVRQDGHLEVRAERRREDEEKVDTVKTVKPQEVEWDEEGMTWEVYGASLDLESLGKTIQSHLESKIREQQNHIRTLRKSVCSSSSFRGHKKKKKRRAGKFLGCCMKTAPVAD